ncbi:MAG: cytochrome c [Acidobacteriia bacterium]|nr:cytochrome c [Terriglobia bacterium]
MFKTLVGIVLGVLLVAAGVGFYFATGRAPVAVTDPPMPFEKKLANIALHAYIEKQKPQEPAVPADEKNYLAGAQVYKQNCAVCHGLPGQPKTAIAEGMYPSPPQLFRGMGVTDDPAFETYIKARNGIRMTGMPGFKSHLTDIQLWQVSLLLANADKIPAAVKSALEPEAAPQKPAAQ